MAFISKAQNVYEIKKGEGLNANIAQYLDIKYTTQAYICVEFLIVLDNSLKIVIQCISENSCKSSK